MLTSTAMTRALAFILFATIAAAQNPAIPWPVPANAQEAYDFAQARRAEAETLWKKKDPTGIELLLKTLPYFEQRLVRDLAAGDRFLASRPFNIYMDLAEAYAIQGQ